MLIQFLLEEDIKSIDLQSNMAQILASSTATWFIFNVLICFYSERWLVWTSRYYCAQKINNVFYKWALYYCYYHHSLILKSKKASSLVPNMIGYDCLLMAFIHLLNYTHGYQIIDLLLCQSLRRKEEKNTRSLSAPFLDHAYSQTICWLER